MMLKRTVAGVTCAVLWGFSITLSSNPALAGTQLNRAVVETLRNQVRLLQPDRPARLATVSDALVPGEGLATGQSSLAELRFNDGSLARMGEQCVFWFTPQDRTFRLSNGTLLMLIPPGQGQTQIQTPNVTAGIRGSALFIRFDAESNTTLVGALTNSGIEVSNADNTQRQELQAGQMAVVVEDQIEGLYEFDLDTFYQTSPLVEGLQLGQAIATSEMSTLNETERAILAVREETAIALELQQFDVSPENGSAPLANQDSITAELESNDINTVITANEVITLDELISESTIELEADVMANPNAQVYSGRRPNDFPGQGHGVDGGFPGQGGGVDGGFPPRQR